MRNNRTSNEHKIAKVIAKVISDLTLDLEQIGIYLGREYPNVIYHRLEIIKESAENEKEAQSDRRNHHPLF